MDSEVIKVFLSRCCARRLQLLAAVLLFPLLTTPARSQEIPGWDPVFDDPGLERRLTLGVDMGKPMIFGLQAGYRFDARTSAEVGFASLGDFAALSGGVRWGMARFDIERPIPYVSFGFTQYFLADGPEESSPLAMQAALGVDYIFLSYFGAGMELGYLEALGRSRNPGVDRYGINDDAASLYFAVNGSYHF